MLSRIRLSLLDIRQSLLTIDDTLLSVDDLKVIGKHVPSSEEVYILYISRMKTDLNLFY